MTTLPSVNGSAPSASSPLSVAVPAPGDDRADVARRQLDGVAGQRAGVGGRVDGTDGEVVVLALGEAGDVVVVVAVVPTGSGCDV